MRLRLYPSGTLVVFSQHVSWRRNDGHNVQSERESCFGIRKRQIRFSLVVVCCFWIAHQLLDGKSHRVMASGQQQYRKHPEYSMPAATPMDQLMQGPLVAWVCFPLALINRYLQPWFYCHSIIATDRCEPSKMTTKTAQNWITLSWSMEPFLTTSSPDCESILLLHLFQEKIYIWVLFCVFIF